MSESFFSRVKEKLSARSAEADAITIPGEIKAPQILDSRESNGYLTGQLLIATPVITGTCFQKSVIYVFSHNDEGAMGIIVNQPLEVVNFSTLLESAKLPETMRQAKMPVYFGGPVDRSRGFVVHSTEQVNDLTLMHKNGVGITTSSTILQEIAAGRGPRHAILGVGYAGWTAGQQEAEIAENS